eukprot:SAG31_NODE_13450_length_868_cov_1.925878_2_plen_140_part_01
MPEHRVLLALNGCVASACTEWVNALINYGIGATVAADAGGCSGYRLVGDARNVDAAVLSGAIRFEAAGCPLTSQRFPVVPVVRRVCTCYSGSPGVDSCAQHAVCVNAACDDGVDAETPTWRETDACVVAASGGIVCSATT